MRAKFGRAIAFVVRCVAFASEAVLGVRMAGLPPDSEVPVLRAVSAPSRPMLRGSD